MKFTGSRYISHGNQLLDSFQELRALRDLQIGYHGSFTRQSLRSLTKLPHLHSLYLRDGVDPGRALEGLTESKSLTHFRISPVLLSEQTIRSLSSLLNLEHLRVCPTERVGLDWMKYLRPLRYLRSLDFSQSRFIEQGELTNLAGLPMLEEINLDGSHITGKGMADLQNLTGLKRVYLDGAGFGGEVLKHLQPLNQLTTLSLRHFQMNDAGAKHLIAHPSLRLIYLSESEVSEKVIKKLKAARPDLIVCS